MANTKKDDEKEKKEILNVGKELDKSKKYLDLFNKAKTFNNNRQDAYAENMAFYQGNQHLLKKYKNDKPWVVNMNTPYATVAIDNRVSSLIASDYEGEILPLSPDDIEAVETLNEVVKKEWERMNIDNIVIKSIKGAAVVREYYCHIVLNKNKIVGGNGKKRMGVLEGYEIEPGAIFIDPTARKLKDARYLFISGRISKDEALEKYPKIKHFIDNGDSFTPEDRGEVYIDNDYNTEQSDVYTVLTYYGKKQGKIEKIKMVSGIIVEEKVDDKAMNLKNFPIAQFRWKKAAQSCYGLSLMDDVISLQKAVNSIESSITNTAIAYAAPQLMVRKGSGVDPRALAKANGAPGAIFAVDGNLDNAIRPVIAPKIDGSILDIKNSFQSEINNIAGNSQQFLGNIGTAGNTSGGAELAVERAKIIEMDVLNNISEYVEDITNIIIDYVTKIYAGETLNIYEGKKEGKHVFKDLKMPKEKQLEGMQFRYKIELDTKTPYSKEKQKKLLTELYQFESQYDVPVKTVTVSDIIKNTDLENKDEIIDRYNKLNFQDSQTKAEAITQLYKTATDYGIDESLIEGAVAELVGNQKETPYIDKVRDLMKQAFQQQMAQNDQNINNAVDTLMASPQQQMEVQQAANQMVNQGVNQMPIM